MMHAYLTHLLLQKHWLSFYFGYISDRQIHNPLITSPLAVGSLIVLFSYLLLKVPIVADTVLIFFFSQAHYCAYSHKVTSVQPSAWFFAFAMGKK
jgi:hypothetical protein